MSNNRTQPLALIGGLALCVWLLGAFGAGLYYNFDAKRQCIHDEGWLKGWLWCSTETSNSFAFSMLRGLLWPITIFRTSAPSRPYSPADGSALSTEQLELIASRCDEAIANNKRRYPNTPPPGPSFRKLCIAGHSDSATKGEVSFLTMSPDDYAAYQSSRPRSDAEQAKLLADYQSIASPCAKVTIKSIAVQPIIRDEGRKQNVKVEAREMASAVLNMKPVIPNVGGAQQAAIVAHFSEHGPYGTTLEYFLTEYDSCVRLGTAVLGLLPDDIADGSLIQSANKDRADIAKMFEASGGLRDAIYKEVPGDSSP